jgi:hypothetical protein
MGDYTKDFEDKLYNLKKNKEYGMSIVINNYIETVTCKIKEIYENEIKINFNSKDYMVKKENILVIMD